MKSKEVKEILLTPGAAVARLEKFVEEMLDYYNVPGEYFGNIVLANLLTTEMLMGRLSREEQVRVSVRRDEQGLCFCHRIKQENGRMDELDEIDLAREQSVLNRDVFIIRSLTDAVQVKANGRIIELRFTINGIDLERVLARYALLQGYFISNTNNGAKNEGL